MTETIVVRPAKQDATQYQVEYGQDAMRWSLETAYASDVISVPESQNPLWDISYPFASTVVSPAQQVLNDQFEGYREFMCASSATKSESLQSAQPLPLPCVDYYIEPDLLPGHESSPKEETEPETPPPSKRRRLSTVSDTSHSLSTTSPPSPHASKIIRCREANRLAAAKCRTKTKRDVSTLQEREQVLVQEHVRLSACVNNLRDEVLDLKNEILRHGDCDSDVITAYIDRVARQIA